MPTYEYRCPAGHSFEKFYSQITNRRREKCPECGRSAQRLISGGAAFLFKGSGFYITDYKRAGDGARKAAEGEAKPADQPADQPAEGGTAKKKGPPSDK